jgi:hypothetical protein
VVASSPSSAIDTATWLTHQEAADVCRVSYNTIKNWVQRGLLHPQRALRTLPNSAHREVQVFDPRELSKMARRKIEAHTPDDGEVAARAFELFESGKSLREAVIELRETLPKVEELHEQWLRCGGSELVITPVAQREFERLVGVFDGVAGLVQRVSELVTTIANQGAHR